jgi:hypothetical protein
MSAPRFHLHRPARAAVPRRPWLAMLALLAMLVALPRPLAGADPALALEYKVKAGYLYNFAKYVEWPSSNATNAATTPDLSPIVIGVVGGAEVLPILQQVLQGKSLEGRPLQVKAVAKPVADTGCHILFFHHSFGQSPTQIGQALSNAPVLVVGDGEQFAEKGGMIGFVREEESFRIHLNLAATARAGLKVSSKLSSVAHLVKSRQDP